MLNYSDIILIIISAFVKIFRIYTKLLSLCLLFVPNCFAKRLKRLIGINTTNTVKGGGIIQVHGTCLPGYEPVRDRFIQNFCDGLECNSQLCVYVNNTCVVDLFGTAIGDTNYGPDNIQVKTPKD